jgi:hypothetical protein
MVYSLTSLSKQGVRDIQRLKRQKKERKKEKGRTTTLEYSHGSQVL